MPGEVITEPNPKPQPSHLPSYVEQLSVKLGHEQKVLDQDACDSLLKFRRAASYIAAGKSVFKYIYIYIYIWWRR
jgi:xylulose-5-phosphate/fructose-6-phosphate phosphoketolase